ncbi:unnamed protein product [Lymnaea stagnalis]|uniref:Uncharacterized protein n=1 Tax=Lymnaea stagnalis TaxID=6523 RepID=A0AAV2H5B1_LYMST
MALYTSATQGLIHLVMTSLSLYSLYIVHTYASPLQDNTESEKNPCPTNWFHYERFCVTRGAGASDRAVAIYCDGFGGIGIKGLCIIRAPIDQSTSAQIGNDLQLSLGFTLMGDNPEVDSPLDTDPRLSAAPNDVDTKGKRAALLDGSSTSTMSDPDVDLDSEFDDSGVCPQGWTHYRSLCVYKPWSLEERCRHMNAVEFNGLCLKHAEVRDVSHLQDGTLRQQRKRICCCSSVKGRPNKYGC